MQTDSNHKSSGVKFINFSGLTRDAVLRYLTRFSQGRYALNLDVYHPGTPLFGRVHCRWSLSHLGEVRRIELEPGEFVYFSLTRHVPYGQTPRVWSFINPTGVAQYLNDPDFDAGLITEESEEFEYNPVPEGENPNNVNNAEQSSDTSEFGAN